MVDTFFPQPTLFDGGGRDVGKADVDSQIWGERRRSPLGLNGDEEVGTLERAPGTPGCLDMKNFMGIINRQFLEEKPLLTKDMLEVSSSTITNEDIYTAVTGVYEEITLLRKEIWGSEKCARLAYGR